MEEAYEPILEDEENEDLFRFWGDLDFYPLMISGLNLESSGEYEDAIAEFEAALDIQLWERDNFEPLFDLGRVNFRLERFEDAKDYLEEYIERVEVQLDPDVEQDFGLSEEYIEELEGTVECAEILLDEIDEIDETETVAEENETED
jgi:tetratricopeptide (TPR) repeat protein